MKILELYTFILISAQAAALAAVGCTLNNPDRDILRLFPEATNYKTQFITIEDNGGQALLKEFEEKLGDKFEPKYESIEVPYAYYTVLKKDQTIGYVHGVNQKGRFGGMQLILATEPNGLITDFYYQKLTSPESKKFRNPEFTSKFNGLTLADFYQKDISEIITDPTEKNYQDYKATIRGIFKNLIMYDEFMLENLYDEVYQKTLEKNNDPNSVEQKNDGLNNNDGEKNENSN